jgi:hypothetical protein
MILDVDLAVREAADISIFPERQAQVVADLLRQHLLAFPRRER